MSFFVDGLLQVAGRGTDQIEPGAVQTGRIAGNASDLEGIEEDAAHSDLAVNSRCSAFLFHLSGILFGRMDDVGLRAEIHEATCAHGLIFRCLHQLQVHSSLTSRMLSAGAHNF